MLNIVQALCGCYRFYISLASAGSGVCEVHGCGGVGRVGENVD